MTIYMYAYFADTVHVYVYIITIYGRDKLNHTTKKAKVSVHSQQL